jgi:hypothetical protein
MLPLLAAALLTKTHLTSIDVIANVRRAIAPASAKTRWDDTVLTGSAEFRGISHGYKLQFRSSGQFCQTIDGKLSQTLGFDGKSHWQIDSSGATRRLAFEDVDRVDTVLFLLTDYWLDPNAPVNCSAPVQSAKDGFYTIHLAMKGSGLDEIVRIDAKTWLPTYAEFEKHPARRRSRFPIGDLRVQSACRSSPRSPMKA